MPKQHKGRGSMRTGPGPLSREGKELLARLSQRTKLSEAEVLTRALSAYATAVAPDLKAPQKTLGRAAQKPAKAPRLFLSIEGGPEREARAPEAIIGSAEGCDVRIDLPLIGARHARLLLRDGRWVFEDLGTPRGSYQRGALVQVAFVGDGDEI